MKNYKQNKLKFFVFLVFSLLIISPPVFASTTDGTIDPDSHYAWGENVGWVDFGSTIGDIHITDDTLSGYAYGENIGWINLEGVTNDKEGNLSGYAWGENVGWIDFSEVIIDNHGYFTGQAYGENIGFISFNKENANNVMTDWRPKSSRADNTNHSSSRVIGGSSSHSVVQPSVLPVTPPTTPPLTITPIPLTTATPLNLTRTLKLNITGDDVKALQVYLNTHGHPVALTGPGSLNNETTKFGPLTKKAVIAFQKANNLTPDGIVGPITRGKLK